MEYEIPSNVGKSDDVGFPTYGVAIRMPVWGFAHGLSLL
jgi:hypothetical protein